MTGATFMKFGLAPTTDITCTGVWVEEMADLRRGERLIR